MPKITARRLFDDDKPDGYLESFREYTENNQEAVEWFLENHKQIQRIINFYNSGGF